MKKAKLTASQRKKMLIEKEVEAQRTFFEKNFGIIFKKWHSNKYIPVLKIENEDWVFFCGNECLNWTGEGTYIFEPLNWTLEEKIIVEENSVEFITIAIGNNVSDGKLLKVNPENLSEKIKNHLQDIVLGCDDFMKLKDCKIADDEFSSVQIKIKGRYLYDSEN